MSVCAAAALVALLAGAARTAESARPPVERRAPDYAVLHGRLLAGETAADLEDALPGLAKKLAAARAVSASDWTDSLVRDELAGGDILPGEVLVGLGIPVAVSSGVAHVPAGVMHTYGYLFSQLKTAYGLKGRRWTHSYLDARLGLPLGTFSPRPPRGEFLANVTKALRDLVKNGAGGRVEEEVLWRTPAGTDVRGLVRTWLFPLKPFPGLEKETHLLVYELETGGRSRLVTAFPVSRDFAAGLEGSLPERGTGFVPRFNLFVDPAWRVVSRESRGFLTR
jgi:hypothetical protein